MQEAFAPLGEPEAVGRHPQSAALAGADCAVMRDGWRQYRDGRGTAGAVPDNSFGRIKWFQAVHMPRWASRITLCVDSVRTESLHLITNADAIAEGYGSALRFWESPVERYRQQWNATRGTPGERWEDDPTVIVLGISRGASS